MSYGGVSALAAITAIGAANAADMATKAPFYKAAPIAAYNWTGVYLGINGGGGWGRESWVDNSTGLPADMSHRPKGGIFGGQLGYRWQMNQFVFGVEGTWDWAGLKDTVTSTLFNFTEDFKIKSLYTVTGQAGWTVDRALLYVKGGWAGARTAANFSFGADAPTATPATFASHSASANGWTVGGGIDYAIWQNWTIGVEYDHLSLGYQNFTTPPLNGAGTEIVVTDTSRLTVDQVVGRLSYKFN